MAGLLAWAVDPALRVWQAPPTWAEALAFSPIGGGLGARAPARRQPRQRARCAAAPLGWREATAIFLLPFLFTSLFLLSSAHLLADLGRAVGIGRWFGWYGEATFGRIVLLFLFNEFAIVGGGWLIDGHWTRSWRLRAPAAAQRRLRQPLAADRELRLRCGGGRTAAVLLQLVLLPLIAAAALAGLWAQTFLLTGLMLDAIRGRRPAVDAGIGPLARRCDQGRDLQLRLHAAGPVRGGCSQTPPLWSLVSAVPAVDGGRRRNAALPAGRTIIESFDGSAPFFGRLRANAASRTGYARGFVVGCGLAWRSLSTCRAASPLPAS